MASGVANWLTTGQAFGRVHCDGANGVFAEMLRDFENEAVAIVLGFKRRENGWKRAGKADIDNSADDLRNAASRASHIGFGRAGPSGRGRGIRWCGGFWSGLRSR